ncbi:MAG: parallel beta-helix domain-containing protein [Pseudomonadales bacterium]
MSRHHRHGLIGTLLLAVIYGCAEPSTSPSQSAVEPPSVEESLRQQFENAQPGDVIVVPAGKHEVRRPLVLNTDGVTVRGSGMAESILSFANQIAGAEGILVNASNFTIEDLAIEDSIGDALKINEGQNITVRRVRTEWTNGPDTENGAYGIYPVLTENTLIDGAIAIGASDAGIYVGQSKNVIVKNSRAAYNVAGIEIENTVHADVFDNLAEHNTGGILVFNMPDIAMTGHSTRVFNNRMVNNNTANFGAAGTAVAGVPAGSGLVINANDGVQIFDNVFANNNTAHVLISSYFSASFAGQLELAEGFDPYPERILIRNNQFGDGGGAPDREQLEQVRISVFGAEGALPAIVWDGVAPEDRAAQICVQADVKLLNIDAGNNGANLTQDMSRHNCELEPLAAVSLGR